MCICITYIYIYIYCNDTGVCEKCCDTAKGPTSATLYTIYDIRYMVYV